MAGLDFVQIYRGWPDSKLKLEYANKEDYEEKAIKAMEEVLKERGLLDELQKTIKNSEQEKNPSLSIESLAKVASDQDQDRIERHEAAQAEKIREEADRSGNGVFLDGTLRNSGRMVGANVLFMLAGIGWILIFVSIAVRDLPDGLFKWTLYISILLTLFGVWNLRVGKGSIKVYKIGSNSVAVDIKQGKKSFSIQSPFVMTCYAVKTEQSINGIKANSYFNLYMQFHLGDGTKVCLTRNNGTGNLPSGWSWVSWDDPIYHSEHVFDYTCNRKLKLTSLRILLQTHTKNA